MLFATIGCSGILYILYRKKYNEYLRDLITNDKIDDIVRLSDEDLDYLYKQIDDATKVKELKLKVEEYRNLQKQEYELKMKKIADEFDIQTILTYEGNDLYTIFKYLSPDKLTIIHVIKSLEERRKEFRILHRDNMYLLNK